MLAGNLGKTHTHFHFLHYFYPSISPHFPLFRNRGVLQAGSGRRTDRDRPLKEQYCEVTFFPNVSGGQVSSCRNYPMNHTHCDAYSKMRTWKGIRYGKSYQSSNMDKCPQRRGDFPATVNEKNSSAAICCYLKACCSQAECAFPYTPIFLSVHFLPLPLPRVLCGGSWSSGNIRLHLLKHVSFVVKIKEWKK